MRNLIDEGLKVGDTLYRQMNGDPYRVLVIDALPPLPIGIVGERGDGYWLNEQGIARGGFFFLPENPLDNKKILS